jgi:hypothetical protein
MRIIYVFFLVLVLLVGCYSDYSEKVIKTGKITKITKQYIYLDGEPLKAKNRSDLEVGLNVKVTFIDTTAEEDWDPDDFEVKEIEIIE